MRLDKYLCLKALGTRSQVRDMIRSGRVSVNGQVARDGAAHIRPELDQVSCDGQPQSMQTEYHLMLNKPEGVLTAARDSKQKTVLELLPPHLKKSQCMPIGRLDKDTTGLLLFTTDGQMNHLLLSPRRQVDKVYVAKVRDELNTAHIQAFEMGLALSDFTALPARLEILEPKMARITVCEGKFHQIKRMFEAVGNEVLFLHREAFGGVCLDPALEKGQWRELTGAELALLREKAGMTHE